MKKLALSIRGGGAQGIAYYGAVQAIRDSGIRIDMMIGTSAGALTACLQSLDVPPERVIEEEGHLHLWSFIGVESLEKKSLMSEHKLTAYIREYFVGDYKLEDLPIKSYVQVTNQRSGRGEILEKGDVATILNASCAMPPIMSPVEIDGKTYIDGGYTCGYDASFLMGKGAEVVVGMTIDQDDMFDREGLNFADYSYMIVRDRNIRDNTCDPVDLLIDGLGDSSIGMMDFQNSIRSNLYERGYEKGVEFVPKIKQLLAD